MAAQMSHESRELGAIYSPNAWSERHDASRGCVAGAGDVNGDGIDDLIIGAPWADPDGRNGAGENYVVFGSAAGYGASLGLASLDGANGFHLVGIGTT